MKRASFLVLAIACGGGSSSSQPTSAPTQTAAASAAPADSSAAPTPQDNSPTPIGSKHKKVGNGWFLSGGGKDFYDAIYEPGAEPVVVVKQTSDPHGRWVTLMKNVSAAPYVGKKIRVRLGVKTTGATGRAEVWARASAPHTPEDAPSTTTKLDPNAEMKTYEVTIDVKDGTRVIEYGASLAGDGELRVGKDSIDVL